MITTKNEIIRHFFDSYHPFGGLTYAYKVLDNIIFVGVAYCSHKDLYSRKVGRKLAIENLDTFIKNYNETGESYIIKSKYLIGFIASFDRVLELGSFYYGTHILIDLVRNTSDKDSVYGTFLKSYTDELGVYLYDYQRMLQQHLLDNDITLFDVEKYAKTIMY